MHKNFRPSHENLALGDIISINSGGGAEHAFTVRLAAKFPFGTQRPYQNGGFVILGEFERILAFGKNINTLYTVTEDLPESLRINNMTAEGQSGFLAAHLPMFGASLEMLVWRSYMMPGSIDPIIIIHRGPQMLIYNPACELEDQQITAIKLQNGQEKGVQSRYAVLVEVPKARVEESKYAETKSIPITRF
jgi:hypothetical protein